MILTDYEVQILYDYLSKEWVPYENTELRALLVKLRYHLDDIEFQETLPVLNDNDI